MTAYIASSAVDVGRLRDHLEVALGLEQLAEAAAYDGMVVGDHDANNVPARDLRLICRLVRHAGVSTRGSASSHPRTVLERSVGTA